MTRLDIISQSDLLDSTLERYRDVIADDFAGYRGHLYRVLTCALHFLGGDETHRREIEVALVYHDIGLWTASNLAYLEPSIARFREDYAHDDTGLDKDLVENIIYWHHKVTPWKGPGAPVVNAVRKADWIDASKGMMRKGLSPADVKALTDAIPVAGFHDALNRLAGDLAGGSTPKGLMRVLTRVYKW